MGLILPEYLARRREAEERAKDPGPWRVVRSSGDSLAAFEIALNIRQMKWCKTPDEAWAYIQTKIEEEEKREYYLFDRDDTMVVLKYRPLISPVLTMLNVNKLYVFYAVFSLRQSNAMTFRHPWE